MGMTGRAGVKRTRRDGAAGGWRLAWSALLLCLTAVTPACSGGEGSGSKQGAPRIEVDSKLFDFGQADNDGVIEHGFVLRNSGTAPLRITKVKPSCGCTATALKQKMIPPGMETSLDVRFNLQGRQGRQQKSIRVESNDPAQPRITLWVKGTAVAELTAVPTYVNLGKLGVGTETVRRVEIVSRKPDLKILEVMCDSPLIDVTPWRAEGGAEQGFELRTVPPLESGHLQARVVVTTDHESKRSVTVSVYGSVVGEIMVIPREIVLRKNAAGPLNRAIILRPGTVEDFRIKGVECSWEGAKTALKEQGRAMYRIDLRDIRVSEELDGQTVRITTDNTRQPEVVVPIRVIDE